MALLIAIRLVRKTVPIYYPKTHQTSYQSPFTKNEYIQYLLRVALPGRPQQQVAYRYRPVDSLVHLGREYGFSAFGPPRLFPLESSRTIALSEAARVVGRFQPCKKRYS